MTTQKTIIKEFKKRFGVSLITGKERLDIDIAYNRVDEAKAIAYLETFLCDELSIYSRRVFKASRLSSIVLCKNLASLGEKSAGLANLRWQVFTWFLGNQIIIDAHSDYGTYNRKVIHHELYHAIDSADDFNGLFDNRWKKLNTPGFVYNEDLIQGQEPRQRRTLRETRGFISSYAMQAVHEDKAEVFSHMIVDYKGIEALAKKDPILERKMHRMKELMNSVSSEFDEEFWKERDKASKHLEIY